MRIKLVKISELKLAEYNPRQISEHDMASLVNSIREFGIVEPVVVNKNNTVIGGHQRLIACQQLLIEKVPVVHVNLPKKKEKILNLALNRIHGEWDLGKLSIILDELKTGNGDDLALSGFELGEIGELKALSSGEFQRPSFDGIMEEFEQPETGKSPKDQNWFYVEFYGQNKRFAELTALLGEALKGLHLIDADAFYQIISTSKGKAL